MLHHDDFKQLLDTKTNVFGSDGEKIGTLGQIYLDDGTNLPQFATVNTGLFGTKENFVPLAEAEISEGQLYVKFTKHFVKDAPNIDPMGHLDPRDEDRLYDYYSQAGLGQEHDRDPQSVERPEDTTPVEPPNQSRTGGSDESTGQPAGAPAPRIRKYAVVQAETARTTTADTGDSSGRHVKGAARQESPDFDRMTRQEGTRPGREEMAEGQRRVTEEGPERKSPGRVDRMDP